jgi:CSLREA domain-containing protein
MGQRIYAATNAWRAAPALRRCLGGLASALAMVLSIVTWVVPVPARAAGLPDCNTATNLTLGTFDCDAYATPYVDGQPGSRVLAANLTYSPAQETIGQMETLTFTNELTPFQDDWVKGDDTTSTLWGMYGLIVSVSGPIVSVSPPTGGNIVATNLGQTMEWEATTTGIGIGINNFPVGQQFSITFRPTIVNPVKAAWLADSGLQPTTSGRVGWWDMSASVRVIPEGTSLPVAHMNWTPDGLAADEFTFDGSPSTSTSPATIARYHWNFGDGTTADTTAPTTTVVHRFASEGDKTVTLTVTDSNGNTASDSETIGPSLRVEQLQFDPSVLRPNTAVRAALTLENDGTSTLYGVVPSMTSDQPSVLAPGPTPAAQDIGPAQAATFVWPVQTGTDGHPTLTLSGQGTTRAGKVVVAPPKLSKPVVGNPGILVDIAGEQANLNDDFQVKVTLSNPGADDITGITYNDPSGIVEADVAPAKGVATLLTASVALPTVLHAGESVALTYAFHAGADGSAVFTTKATGTTPDLINGGTKTVTDTTSLSVTITDSIPTPAGLDSAAQAAWDQAGQILAGGYQNTQNILGSAITQTGQPAATESDYEAIRESGLSPGLAALAENPTGLNAFGQGYANEARKLTSQTAGALGQGLLTAYTAAKDPQTWSSMASAAYQQMKSLPASTLQNAGYLGVALAAAQTPQGVATGIVDTATAGQAAATSLQATANNAANNLTNEVLANRRLARSDPNAYYQKLGGYMADAEVTTAGAAVNLAVGDIAMKPVGQGLSILASRVGLGAIENTASGVAVSIDAAAATADGESGQVALARATAGGTGSGATGLASIDGAVSQFQQLEAGGVITTTNASTMGGILPSDAQKINGVIANVKQKYGVQLEIGTRTSEPLSLGLNVSPKLEIIKPKAVSVMDQLLGAPKDAAGQATVFKPVPLSANQVAAYEAQSPGFAAAYDARLSAQQALYDDYTKGNNLSLLVDASKAVGANGQPLYPNGVTAIVGRPQPLGKFAMPTNLVYVEQLDDPAYLAANNISQSYAQGLKQQIQSSYPDLMKVKIDTVQRADGSITFIDGLQDRPYGSDLDVQYVRPANGAPWPPGLRGQIETDVNAQFKQLSRYPNHGWSDAAADLNSAYYAAAAKFQMGNVDPAVAGIQAQAIFARYQLTAQILEQQSGRLAAMAATATDPTQKALLLAQAAALHKSALKMGATTLSDIEAYGSGEKILIFTGGDIRVGYTPLLNAPHYHPRAGAVAARASNTSPGEPTTTFTVTSLADGPAPLDGACETGGAGCTLREAMAEATAGQVPVTIDLPAGTIDLTNGPLQATAAAVTLTGSGTTIDGASASTLIQTSGGSLTISGLTLTNGTSVGDSAAPGGAISADGTAVTLRDSTVSHDQSDTTGGGVFVADGGSLTLLRATFTDDYAGLGGAVAIADSALSVTDSTLDADGAALDGGAIHASDLPSLSITSSTLNDDTAGQRGGAVFIQGANGPVTLTADTFAGDTSGAEGGAVAAVSLVSSDLSQQVLDVTGGTFTADTGRTGGAIAADDAPLTVQGVTFSGNTSDLTDGGAIAASGPLTIRSAKFTGNTAYGDGGAVTAGNVTTITGSAFSNNTSQSLGGALALLGPGADTLTGGSLGGDRAAYGGSEVWRDGGALTTDDVSGPALLTTLDGQVVAAAHVRTRPPTGTGKVGQPASGHPAAHGPLAATGASVVQAFWTGIELVLIGITMIALAGQVRRRRKTA